MVATEAQSPWKRTPVVERDDNERPVVGSAVYLPAVPTISCVPVGKPLEMPHFVGDNGVVWRAGLWTTIRGVREERSGRWYLLTRSGHGAVCPGTDAEDDSWDQPVTPERWEEVVRWER